MVLKEDHLKGASAVIDKDFASCLLAKELDADMLIILTAVEKVAIHFGKKDEKWLSDLTVEEAKNIWKTENLQQAPCFRKYRLPLTSPPLHLAERL